MNPLVKAVYRSLPLRKHIFTGIRAFGVPRSYRRMYFQGEFSLRVDATHSFRMVQHNRYGIETELFWNGLDDGWETASLAIWKQLCRQSKVIIDVGAAEGLYALVAKCLHPAAQVHAFEPFEQPYAELATNGRINGYTMELHREALSNFTGNAQFYAELYSSNEGSLLRPAEGSADATVIVPVTTLAEVIERFSLKGIDAMKIDVEGAEPEVLEGMGRYLAKFRPAMIIEVLNDDVGKKVEALVRDLDYAYFDVNDDKRKGPKAGRLVDHIRKSTCLNYALIPTERVATLEVP